MMKEKGAMERVNPVQTLLDKLSNIFDGPENLKFAISVQRMITDV